MHQLVYLNFQAILVADVLYVTRIQKERFPTQVRSAIFAFSTLVLTTGGTAVGVHIHMHINLILKIFTMVFPRRSTRR